MPSFSNALIEKMNGPAPVAVSGNPASAVAFVVTCQLAIPSAPRNELRCARPTSTVTATPFEVSIVTSTVDPEPFVKLFDAATSRARAIAVVV